MDTSTPWKETRGQPMTSTVKREASETNICEQLDNIKAPRTIKILWKGKHDKLLNRNKPRVNIVSKEKSSSASDLQLAVRTILANSNATPINCHTGTYYKCCFCPQTFTLPGHLKKHNIHMHFKEFKTFTKGVAPSNFFVKLDITDLKCNICMEKFSTIDDIIEHLNDVHSKQILQNVKNFIFPFIFNGDELKCTKCEKTYNSFKMLQEHMNVHYKNYMCDICDSGFVTPRSLAKHVLRHKNRSENLHSENLTLKTTKIVTKPEEKEAAETENVKEKQEKICTNYVLRKYLPSVRELLIGSNATAIGQHSGSFFKCSFCYEQFQKPADLKQHNIEIHLKDIGTFKKGVKESTFYVKMDITNLKCNYCEEEISSIDDLIEHLNNEHNKNILTEIKKLIFPFKFDSEELRCCNCFKIFYTFKHLQEHMHVHYSNHICDVCSAGFVTLSSLKIHQGSHKTGKFKCSKCNKTFLTIRTKMFHEQYVHDASSLKNVCRVCGERFKDYLEKKRHLVRVHGVGAFEFKCQSCDKVLASRRGLTCHVQSYHLMLRPHACQVCTRSFFSLALLKNHMLTHTGKKDFQCDVCSKKFARKFTLMEHMRIHLNDRKFKCTVCKQAFVQKCSLKGHMRSKHGVELAQ